MAPFFSSKKRGDPKATPDYCVKVNIPLPPLRERKEDIIDLTRALLGRINRELHRNVNQISWDVVRCLEQYEWQGNVRELENVLIKSVALSHGDSLTRDLLPETLCPPERVKEINHAKPTETWSLEEMEANHIRRVLDANNWHKGNACEILGISRPRLRRMIKQYHLSSPDDSASDDGDTHE